MKKKAATDDDYDNLITLHGVLSAFLLSIAISAQKDVSPGSMQYSTFLGAVAKEQISTLTQIIIARATSIH